MPDTQKAVEVFYSYAHADKRWVTRLETHLSLLKRQGLISVWHDRRLLPGIDWSREIDIHLTSASVILLLISPDFLASDYCYGLEMQRALEREQAGEARVIPILLRPVEWQSAPFARLQVLPLDAKPITTWSNKDSAFATVAAGIRRVIEDLTLQSTSTAQTILWNVPLPRNPFFLGREGLLIQLHQQLQQRSAALSQRQAISGLGGVGKTQLAVEYAYRYREAYQAVLWVRAETTETLNASYSELASVLHLPEQHAQEQALLIQAVKRWLQASTDWLLICDNADQPDLLTPFLPSSFGGRLLVTTRARALGRFGIAQPLIVDSFLPEQGALFLLRRAGWLPPDASVAQAPPQDRELARQITQQLGGLPLALDQAGAYLEETGTSLQTYLQIYQQHRAELLSQRRGPVGDHPEPVATTWSLSFQRVEEASPAAADLLRFCAFLASDAIGEELFSNVEQAQFPVLAPVARNAYRLNQALETLRAYSLIERDPVTKTVSVHRLVQAILCESLPPETQRHWIHGVVTAMSQVFPNALQVDQWPMCERFLPHALSCVQMIEQEHLVSTEAAYVLNQVAVYLGERGRPFREIEPLYQRALRILEQVLGAEHPDTATILNNLAGLYQRQGKYEEAEPLYQKALEIWEQVQGAEHPETARILNNLAALYQSQGKYEEAEPLVKRALEIWEQVQGAEHPETARILNNLAALYESQGKYEEAEPLVKRALEIREQVQGAEHPNTATSLNNLAGLYERQGKYEEAEPLYQRALRILEQVLGAEHPDAATSLNNLAGLYERQGKYEEAGLLYQKALEIWEQVLGAEHPNTATSLNNLAGLYESQGKYEKAEPLVKRALGIREQVLGAEHPDTAASLNNLAGLYQRQGKYEEVESLYQRALGICEQVLGAEHPNTATSLGNLAGLYQRQGKYEEAEPLMERALAICEQVLGAEHPDTAASLNNLAGLYESQGKYEEAELLYQRALGIREQMLGAEHPDTATSLNNLAGLYQRQGRYEEAGLLYQRALDICEQVLGAEHPNTATILDNLAGLYQRQGKYEEAEPLMERALAICEQVLGAEHPGTQLILVNYLACLQHRA